MTTAARTLRDSTGRRTPHRAQRALTPLEGRNDAHGVVHVSAECWPFARTGGLGEVVSTLASHHAADGVPTTVVLPLYGQVIERAGSLERATPKLSCHINGQVEHVRLWRARSDAGSHQTFFIDHPLFSERRGVYGENGDDYADNAQRFALFCIAALTALPHIAPGARVVHAHDWHAALVPVHLRTTFATSVFHRQLAAVLSIHNAAFQGHVMPELMPALGLAPALYDWRLMEWYGRVNVLKGGLAFADAVTTVSPTYARELTTADGGFGLHEAFAALGERLVGILNGIDQEVWDPATDRHLVAAYSATSLAGKRRCKAALQRSCGLPVRDDMPVVAMCARMTAQKGIDLVLDSEVLGREDVQLVFLGEGETRYIDALRARATEAPHRIAVQSMFRDSLEHVLMGGADLFIMPSRYEPCGLAQMRAQRYGALPIARRVGGVADTVDDGVTGFLFDTYAPDALDEAVRQALARYADRPAWRRMMRAAMRRDFGWTRSAVALRAVYRQASETALQREADRWT